MAVRQLRETYSHATIDCDDMTLTEYNADHICTYSINDILKRWGGIPNIEIEIRERKVIPDIEG